MASKSFKDEYVFIERYKSLYKEKYGSIPSINKYKEKWAVSSLMEDFGVTLVNDCMDFYFRTEKDGHPLSWFFFNFNQLSDNLLSQRRDEELRLQRREETQRLAKEYLNGIQG